MNAPKFVWIIRTWSSLDSFWEHVREHKEYDVAYVRPELLLEEIERIILKEKSDWNDLCQVATGNKKEDRVFDVEVPTKEIIQNRTFFKFLTVTTKSDVDDLMISYYIERLKIVDTL